MDANFHGPSRGNLSAALREFVGRIDWDLFVTLSYDGAATAEKRARLWKRLVNKVNREAYRSLPKRQRQSRAIWIRVTEVSGNGRLHEHALFKLVGLRSPLKAATLKSCALAWEEYAGYARVEKVASPTAVSGYVTKDYGRGAEFELSENFPPSNRSR